MLPYDHAHSAVEELTWARLGELLGALAERVRGEFEPDVVVGVAKGGLVPAVFLASALRLDLLPIRLSSRRNDEVVSPTPVWHVRPTAAVRGLCVLLVDDIAVAGRTLGLAAEALHEQGADEVRTATLAVHRDSVRPDYHVLETDALIVWPWDRDVLGPDGRWAINPEYLAAMAEVPGYLPGPSPQQG